MELSVFLAKVLGLYLVIVAPAALLNRRHFPRLIKEFSDSLAMVVLSGFVALVLGLLLVVSHNVWTADWRVIITLLGWLTLIKGVVRFAFPDKVSRLWTAAASSWWAIVLVAFFIIGVYLTYKGFSPNTRYLATTEARIAPWDSGLDAKVVGPQKVQTRSPGRDMSRPYMTNGAVRWLGTVSQFRIRTSP